MHKIKEFILFLKEIYQKRELILSLAKNDFKARNAGSFLGILWNFIIPLFAIFVYWFLFTLGFKSAPIDNIPFMAWFMPAYVPWMFFSECMSNCTSVLNEFNYLVKKVKFRTALLPIVKIESCLMVNLFFVAVMFIILILYKVHLTITAFQVIYYYAALIIMCTGLGWLLSAISVFFRDISSIVNIVIQFGFWLTPIMWSINGMPSFLVDIVLLNPMNYICQGFRDCLLYNINFWDHPRQTIYFWFVTTIIFVGGAMVFRKLRPHFADVL